MERLLGQVLWLVFGGPAAKNIIVDLLWLMQKMAACGIERGADVQIGNHSVVVELMFPGCAAPTSSVSDFFKDLNQSC
jgi:hypothetical protein